MGEKGAYPKSVSPASREVWLSYCRNCKVATFFHTPYWADLFVNNYRGRYKAAAVEFEFDNCVKVLLPMVIKRRLWGILRIASSMPGGTFGCWLSTSPLSVEYETEIFRYLNIYTNCVLRENPYSPLTSVPAGYRFYQDHTRAIDLSSGYEAVWKRSSAGHRNAVRNAISRGVRIKEAVDAGEWESYHSLYCSSIERWKKRGIFTGVKYDRKFFAAIGRLDPSLRKLWLASVNGKTIAGILCFYWNNHAVVWHGAGLSEYFGYHPNNYLYDRAMADAAETGYGWFDCNPSGGLKGVDNFKRYLGAQSFQSRIMVRQSPIAKIVGALRVRQGSGS